MELVVEIVPKRVNVEGFQACAHGRVVLWSRVDSWDHNPEAHTVNATLGAVPGFHMGTMVVGNQVDNEQPLSQVALFLAVPH